MVSDTVRLDRRLRDTHPDLSWRQIRDAIEQGQVTVDGRVQRDPGHPVGTQIDVRLDRNRPARRPTRAPFEILYEDDQILVINKPAGVLSIPTALEQRDVEDTVLRRAREYVTHKLGHRSYVGMLHRLDRDTSGALAIALSKDAHTAGRDLFKRHRFERRYLAIVQGVPARDRGTIESRISSEYRDGRRRLVGERQEGRDARTDYVVRERFAGVALLELRLHTGRQHQIRLHLEKLGHPLIGERVYASGNPKGLPLHRTKGSGGSGETNQPPRKLRRSAEQPPLKLRRSSEASAKAEGLPPHRTKGSGGSGESHLPPRTMLHAWTLAFPHPITGTMISVEAPLPDDFQRLLARLRRTPG
ncbi:MAG: RluA family pseudouridine synthase [Vicinamibacterales bacterium]